MNRIILLFLSYKLKNTIHTVIFLQYAIYLIFNYIYLFILNHYSGTFIILR